MLASNTWQQGVNNKEFVPVLRANKAEAMSGLRDHSHDPIAGREKTSAHRTLM